MATVHAAFVGAVWADDHAAQARRRDLFQACARLHAVANELTAVAIGRQDADDLSPLARTVLRQTQGACS